MNCRTSGDVAENRCWHETESLIGIDWWDSLGLALIKTVWSW